MDLNITISTPLLITGQNFRFRYREYPSGSFGAYDTTTTQVIALTGLTDNTEYELEVQFYDGTEYCPVTTSVFQTKEDVNCPTFSGEIFQDIFGYYVRVSWSGVVGYPIGGYAISWYQGVSSGTLSYPTALPSAGYVDIPLPTGDAVTILVTSNNGATKVCFEEEIPNNTSCTGINLAGATISNNGTSNSWTITLIFTQSSPATLSSVITYIQSDGNAAGSSIFVIPPTATSFSFPVTVSSFTGIQPNFVGSMTDACGNLLAWTI